jgi:hypothetical protein
MQLKYLPVLEKDTVLRLEMFDYDAVNVTSFAGLKSAASMEVRLLLLLLSVPALNDLKDSCGCACLCQSVQQAHPSNYVSCARNGALTSFAQFANLNAVNCIAKWALGDSPVLVHARSSRRICSVAPAGQTHQLGIVAKPIAALIMDKGALLEVPVPVHAS